MSPARDRRIWRRVFRRALGCALGTTLAIGLAASPAWAASVPDPPTAVAAAVGDSQLTVTFTPPANDGGAAISSYTATCTDNTNPGSNSDSGASSPIIVTQLTNGDSYTCAVTATNSAGTGAASSPSASAIPGPTAPDAPTQPTVVPGNGQFNVIFSAPADNGSAIIGYNATCTDTSESETPAMTSGTASPIVVTGLVDGDSYTCDVTATNGDGTSAASPASGSVVFANAPATPTAPTVTQSVTQGAGSLSVAFTQPSGNGGPITNDTATCTDGVDTPSVVSQLGSPIVMTTANGLIPANSYTCQVTATNGVGTSSPSSASTPSVVFATAPAPPAAPVVSQGAGTLVVAFGAPASNGSPISGYSVACVSGDGGALASGSAVVSPVTASGGTVGKSYTCHVDAVNAFGGSGDSPQSSPAVTIAGVPGAPVVSSVVSGNGQVTVAFSAGAPNGDVVVGNTATCSPSGGGVSGEASGVSPIVVAGLTNGVGYACSVVSTNAVGSGVASGSVSVVVGLPGAAGQPTVMAGDSQIVVSFVPPSLNGSPLVAYNATCLSPGNPVAFGSGLGSPVVASGAVDGQGYTCHVTAENSVGDGPDSPVSVSVVPAGVPGFPNPAPTITPGDGVMAVAFVAPADNGAPITSYTATCTSSDGGATGVTSGPRSPIDVTGLTDGNTYTCDVSATNSAGTGSVSDESVAAVENAVPAAPAQPTVVGGPSRVVVSFVVPAANGNTIFETTATCVSSNGGVSRTVVSEPEDVGETFSPIVVGGVTNGKSYTCRVSATNGVGTGPLSPVSAVAVPRTPPGPPTGVKAVSGNATGPAGPVVVSFAAGAANGSTISSFRLTCSDLKDGAVFSKSGPSSPLTVGGLTTGHPYSCVVVALSAGGTSVKSAPSNVTLGAPGQATISKIVQKNHGVTLTLLAPVANGAPITRYVARCTSTDGGVSRGSASPGGELIVTNMSLGTIYTCTVTADNSRGAGTPTKTPPITITK
jgi:hypothetical protein